MKLVNPYGTPGFLFQQYNNRAELVLVVALRETFEISATGQLALHLPRPPVLLADTYDDLGQLLDPADFVPYKPGTDVTVLANAHTPSGQPERTWTVGIEIAGRSKNLRVYGPRFWIPQDAGGWAMGEADPVLSVPLTWRNAFGGPIPRPANAEGPQDRYRFNPLGPGLLDPNHSPRDRPSPAPCVEAENDPITDWQASPVPQGLAPIAPVWRFRQQYCGTYDQTWLDTRHPFLPFDFDYRFYNCAHPDLIFSPFLVGGETVRLSNLHPEYRNLVFTLPRLAVQAQALGSDGTTECLPLAFDGIHIDLRAETPRVRLTWRQSFPWRGGIDTVTLLPDTQAIKDMGRSPDDLITEDSP
jgi:hypothetical protein